MKALQTRPRLLKPKGSCLRPSRLPGGFLSLLLLWAVTAPGQQPAPAPATLSDLRQRLTECVAQPKYDAGLWGVKVVSLDTGKALFEYNSEKLFSPASNSKLYTVAMALDRLGPDYRIKTSLYSAEKPGRNGTLKGDLIIYGRGDPTINARLHGGDILAALQPLVSALTNAGIKRINGDLIADQSFIRGPEYGSGWACDDLEYYYGAEISALTVNDNTLQATVKPASNPGAPCAITVSPAPGYLTISNRTETAPAGTRRSISFYRPLSENVVYVTGHMPAGAAPYTEDLTVHNPAGLFAALFEEGLARAGIKIKGHIRTMNWLDRQVAPIDCSRMVELGSMESPPVRDLAREIEKPSQNLYTDLLLAHMAESVRTPDDQEDTSEDLGIRELNKFLSTTGIKRGEVLFEEGSGLSRDNLTTPNATATLLQYMHHHTCAGAYLDALPIAGVDGTLRNRMKGTPAASNVRAKTGSLRWAASLSGYVTSAAGEHLAFSLMVNRYHNSGSGGSARADLDKIAVLLASFTGKSD